MSNYFSPFTRLELYSWERPAILGLCLQYCTEGIQQSRNSHGTYPISLYFHQCQQHKVRNSSQRHSWWSLILWVVDLLVVDFSSSSFLLQSILSELTSTLRGHLHLDRMKAFFSHNIHFTSAFSSRSVGIADFNLNIMCLLLLLQSMNGIS